MNENALLINILMNQTKENTMFLNKTRPTYNIRFKI